MSRLCQSSCERAWYKRMVWSWNSYPLTARAGLYTSSSNGCLQDKRRGKIATFPCSDMKFSYEISLIKGPCDVGHFSSRQENLVCEHYLWHPCGMSFFHISKTLLTTAEGKLCLLGTLSEQHCADLPRSLLQVQLPPAYCARKSQRVEVFGFSAAVVWMKKIWNKWEHPKICVAFT